MFVIRAGFCATLPLLLFSMLKNDELLILSMRKYERRVSICTSNRIESFLTIHFSSAVSLCHLIIFLYDSTSLTHSSLVFIFLTTTWRPLIDHCCPRRTRACMLYDRVFIQHSRKNDSRLKREYAT